MVRIEPDDQVTAEWRQGGTGAAAGRRPWTRGVLVLCALAVVAASGTAAWALGAVAALGVFVAGTLGLVAALMVLARGAGPP